MNSFSCLLSSGFAHVLLHRNQSKTACVCVCGRKGSGFCQAGQGTATYMLFIHHFVEQQAGRQSEILASFPACPNLKQYKPRMNWEQQTSKLQRLCQSKKVFHSSDLLIWKMLKKILFHQGCSPVSPFGCSGFGGWICAKQWHFYVFPGHSLSVVCSVSW